MYIRYSMNYEVKEALKEIMDIPPIFRREFIVKYLRENLSREEARRYLIDKKKGEFVKVLLEEGLVTREELLEKIGKERILQYFHVISAST